MSVRVYRPGTVYLAGPPYANEYRARAKGMLGARAVDPMRNDFRGVEKGNEASIVRLDLADIDGCASLLADVTRPDEGTAMEMWYAHSKGLRIVAYTGGTPPHPWVVYVSESLHADLGEAIAALG